MEKARFIKKHGKAVFYRLSDHKDFCDGLISRTDWPADAERLVFEFDPFSPKGGYLDPRIDAKKYSLRIAYYANKKDIKIPATFKPDPDMRLVPPRRFSDFKELSKRTLEEFYVRPIRKYISRGFLKASAHFTENILKKCRNAVLFRKGKTIGLVSTFSGNVKEKPGTFVAWVWVDPKVPAKVRRSAELMMAKWIVGRSRGRLGTGEHAKSRKTQKFFSALGFRPERYIVEPMKD